MQNIRKVIRDYVAKIVPLDALEDQHQQIVLAWIDSEAPLFRVQKPDIPNRHLVSYFVVVDTENQSVLLADHKQALLWLPTGGHVEPNEDPQTTVQRECTEELSIDATFLIKHPIFITMTTTVGKTAGHEDVSLWFVLHGSVNTQYHFDTREFYNVKWFNWDQLPQHTDPHLPRFIQKLKIAITRT